MENAPFAGKSISSPPILEPMSWGNNSRESEVKPFQVDVAILEEKMKVKLKDPDGMKHDDAENNTSKSHGPRTLLMAPAQQQQETILVEGTGVVPAKCSPKIKSELFSLL